VFGLLIVAFLFHLSNGIRHLLWDAGVGLEKGQARVSWKIVMAVVLAGSALLFYLLFSGAPA
jgi:succinate dehydrogenase / fumarate reductase cytochrome b subunit